MELLPKINDPKDLRALPEDKIPQVSQEIRKWILDCVSKIGGHLGSSLGSAEITTSLHYVFDTPRDRLIWDTGHQTYGHKILTGRREELKRIRQFDGISGFLKRSESEYDCFGAGHASTAISAALGMAAARDLKGEKNKVVAIVSDGCITGGESYEGLQNAGQVQSDLIVILNDNQMFISQKVGAMSAFLTRLLTLGRIRNAQKEIEKFLARFKLWGAVVLRVAKRAKVLLFPGMLFEEMGFSYFGPIDGHDTHQLIKVFQHIKEMRGPILVHCVTKKGKGYDLAEKDPLTWHGPGKFDVKTGQMKKSNKPALPTYTKVFAKALVKLAEEDPRITAITAAMPEGTGTDAFRDRFPKRFYDVGLAEQHSVTFGAGQACEGFRPVVAVYSTFLQRAYDQIEHDVCLQKLPVVFAIDRGGLVGNDGPTHHGTFDYAMLRQIPNMNVMAPADENELQHMLKTALAMNAPVSLRYPRGEGEGVKMDSVMHTLPIGKGVRMRDGSDATILAIGNRVWPSIRAAEALKGIGISVGVVNMRWVKPLDRALLEQIVAKTPRIITVEDHVLDGGFGSAILEALADMRLNTETLRIGIADQFVQHGSMEQLYASLELDENGIAKRTAAFLGKTYAPVAKVIPEFTGGAAGLA
ncbi:MAG: 1-deoxy-D-xylulose-5-phosphate synthase [Elusimicrobia bacterium CG1_02_63_36]|nr:MAG: 1-deoxy-D-xylulose-5-phosphate synthase [Elusimicrobia bacterium CG1_02_63_36]PIP83264.1 MAG: 1-deoxy-D-xylulose-5-phosphate synthase [Elusimicrobia bacterium CG22_combo_CG10-13_8_21_14_all_63_91]PJA14920.1 MAG: 1-deoxy-D-xylulose-5-phosphate synthase [Elusimicrobia bacterium CG_4_10_14_0_2_um_filter_63_34]PJB26019.1 MAG: 1-deoxy-D-xylulose-5-phosphate synthase [Elusimicrobia bacterium CG_4_9_14_3_um_filter_62_55]